MLFYQTPNRKCMHVALNLQFHPLVFQYHTLMQLRLIPSSSLTSELIPRIHFHSGFTSTGKYEMHLINFFFFLINIYPFITLWLRLFITVICTVIFNLKIEISLQMYRPWNVLLYTPLKGHTVLCKKWTPPFTKWTAPCKKRAI